MSHVVEPLFAEWQRFAPCRHSRMMLTHLRNNRVAWQQHKVPAAALTSSPPPPPTNHDPPGRRHSLPAAARDEAPAGGGSRDRGRRRHSAARPFVDGLIHSVRKFNDSIAVRYH